MPERITRNDIDDIVALINAVATDPRLTIDDRACLRDLLLLLQARAAELDNAELKADTPAIKAISEQFKNRTEELTHAHDNLVAATQGMVQAANAITIFGKLVGVMTTQKK